jgi:guanylate kinase
VSGQGAVFVVSGPSGAGKSTLLRRVLEADPDVRFSVSHTTRAPRNGEVEGRDYHFVSREAFRRMVDAGEFLEWAEYNENLYGTSRAAVEGPTGAGLDLILEVEVQGARQLRERLPGAVFVFILPPSLEVLERRLRARGSEDGAVIRKRLERAREELRQVQMYQYVVRNDQLDRAVADLRHVIGARRVERERVLAQLPGASFD